jgi:SAM-dependent methyltransferase
MTEWHESDAFWEDTAPFVFGPRQWEAAAREAELAAALVDLPDGAAVLDMGCGPGRHAVEFARRGFHVTGVDRTVAALDRAKQRAADLKLDIEWVKADMREFRRPEAFDAAISLYTSFGYFQEKADDRRVLENMLASLRPGGRLALELIGKEILARIFQKRDWEAAEDGTLLLQERHVERDWSWMRARWIVIKGSERREYVLTHRVYSAVELSELAADVGFVDVRVYGSLAGTPYDERAERLVVTARKASGSSK